MKTLEKKEWMPLIGMTVAAVFFFSAAGKMFFL